MSNKKTSLFDVIKVLIINTYKNINSLIGKINITSSFLLFLLAAIVLIQPALHYVLMMLEKICNTFLLIFNKNILPTSNSGDVSNNFFAFIICVISIIGETSLCIAFVNFHEKLKKKTDVIDSQK